MIPGLVLDPNTLATLAFAVGGVIVHLWHTYQAKKNPAKPGVPSPVVPVTPDAGGSHPLLDAFDAAAQQALKDLIARIIANGGGKLPPVVPTQGTPNVPNA